MRIGIGTKHGEGMRFAVTIPFLAPCTLDLWRVENPGERSPHWHITHDGERCGALWRRVPNGGGEAFLSGHIESPLFPGGKLEIAIFASKEVGSQKDMIWRVRTDQPGNTATPASQPQSSPSTSNPSDDDDIPF